MTAEAHITANDHLTVEAQVTVDANVNTIQEPDHEALPAPALGQIR